MQIKLQELDGAMGRFRSNCDAEARQLRWGAGRGAVWLGVTHLELTLSTAGGCRCLLALGPLVRCPHAPCVPALLLPLPLLAARREYEEQAAVAAAELKAANLREQVRAPARWERRGACLPSNIHCRAATRGGS